jgi:hypothetical protein
VYKLTYVRGPSRILVMLAQEIKKSCAAPWGAEAHRRAACAGIRRPSELHERVLMRRPRAR